MDIDGLNLKLSQLSNEYHKWIEKYVDVLRYCAEGWEFTTTELTNGISLL